MNCRIPCDINDRNVCGDIFVMTFDYFLYISEGDDVSGDNSDGGDNCEYNDADLYCDNDVH